MERKPAKDGRKLDRIYRTECKVYLDILAKTPYPYLAWFRDYLDRDDVRMAMIDLMRAGCPFMALGSIVREAHRLEPEVKGRIAAVKRAAREWDDTINGLRVRVNRIEELWEHGCHTIGDQVRVPHWIAQMHYLVDELPEKFPATIEEHDVTVRVLGKTGAGAKVGKQYMRRKIDALLDGARQVTGHDAHDRRITREALVATLFPARGDK